MRIHFQVLGAIAVLGLTAAAGLAQSTTFTAWNFNNLPIGSNINAPIPSTGRGVATPLGMTNNYTYTLTPSVTGSTVACDVLAAGASSDTASSPNNCWRVRGSYFLNNVQTPGIGWALQAPQLTQGARFTTSTVNYANIIVSFDWFTTNFGVRDQQLQYTTDGSTWTSIGPVRQALPNAWRNSIVQDFSAIPAVNDNPNFGIRMVSVWDSTANLQSYVGATLSGGLTVAYNNNSGNWRFDAITFTGIPIRSTGPTVNAVVQPVAVCAQGGPLTFTVNAEGGALPASTNLTVRANLSPLGLSATTALFDDGSNGDLVPGDGIFTLNASIPSGQSLGTKIITITGADAQLRTGTTTVNVAVGDCGQASAARVVISQIYGGGGNIGPAAGTDGVYDADFVELYNRSNQTVDLTGWSVQYASPASTTGFDSPLDQVALRGTLRPGQYALVRFNDPVNGFAALPAPDFSTPRGFGGIGSTGGRVALVRSTTLIGANCADSNVEDLVGYGDSVICFEGIAQAPTPANPTAVVRKLSGTQDTQQNFNDFAVQSPLPRNKSTGGFMTIAATSTAAALCAGSNITFFGAVTPGQSTGITVTADVSQIVGSPSTISLLDNGTAGDVSQNDNTYTRIYTIPASAAQGNRIITITATDSLGNSESSIVNLSVAQCAPGSAPVVISQVYGGGGNATSGFNADFVEIFNRSSQTVNLDGWSIQSARFTDLGGFANRIVNLSGNILPGQYKLAITNQLAPTGATLPAADFTPPAPFGIENEYGQIALANTITPLGTNYTSPNIIDFVGFGQLALAFEGVAPTATVSNVLVAVRKNNGCQDNNQNAVDFDAVLALTLPRNSSSPFNTTCVLPQPGVCCRGVTCSTSISQAACTGPNSLYVSTSPSCNVPGNVITPCCRADFNKSGNVTVQDIFDFLAAWFALSPTADFTTNGANSPSVQSIFDFLSAWFTGC